MSSGPRLAQDAAGDQLQTELSALAHVDQVAGLLGRVNSLMVENEGLAEEVLRSYEQLNLVFDITQQVASTTRVQETERVLLRRIGELLRCLAVVVLREGEAPRTYRMSGRAAPAQLEPPQAQVDRVRQTRAVQVYAPLSGPASETLILGPLQRLDGSVDVIAAQRSAEAGAFNAGDMLMLDSVLSFGSQIIRNSELYAQIGRMSFEVTRALVAAIDKKDRYTSGHSERVGLLARLTGEQLGLSAAELQTLEWAGLLHDVGKIGVPEEILNKPGRLTEAEFDVVKGHPRMGYEILKPIASFEGVLDAVLHHHEAPDGSGYPDGLRDDQISLFAGIIHVVDIFDALTSTRSYRHAFSLEKACEIIRADAGAKVDARLADAFLEAIQQFRVQRADEFAAAFAHAVATVPDSRSAGESP